MTENSHHKTQQDFVRLHSESQLRTTLVAGVKDICNMAVLLFVVFFLVALFAMLPLFLSRIAVRVSKQLGIVK